MPSKHHPVTDAEAKLIARLREHPHLMERFESILALAESEEGKLRTADEIEALLIEEVRRLGAETMQAWACGAHEQVARDFKAKNPSSYPGKKKR